MTLKLLLPLSLAFIMFSMGLSWCWTISDDVLYIPRHGIRSSEQMLMLPLSRFSLVSCFLWSPILRLD